MSVSLQHDIARYIGAVHGIDGRIIATCTTEDNDTYTGRTVDRRLLDDRAGSAVAALMLSFVGGPANAKDLRATFKVQHSSDASSWDDFSTGTALSSAAGALQVGSTTTSTNIEKSRVFSQRVDLRTARRYVRMIATPDASATSSENYSMAGMWAFGGYQELPPDATFVAQGTVSSS